MYPRSFPSEEAKIKQRTSSKKQLCETGEEAIWKSRLTSFCNLENQNLAPKIGNFEIIHLFDIPHYSQFFQPSYLFAL